MPAGSRVHGFLFADLRGYTDFVERHGDQSAVALLATYRDLVRTAVGKTGGAEIKTEGDSFYVVFSSASEAVQCGLAIVAAAAIATSPSPGGPIRVGIGIHAGETAETDEGYVGSAVNLAARICAQAAAGEVLVSDTVRGLTRTGGGVTFTARGRKHLKGIAEPIAVYAATPAVSSAALARRSTRATALGFVARFGDHPRGLALAGGAVIAAVLTGALLITSGLTGESQASPGSSPSGSYPGQGGLASSIGHPSVPPGSEPRSAASPEASGSPLNAKILPNSGPEGAIGPGMYVATDLPGSPTLTISDDGWLVASYRGNLVLNRFDSPGEQVTIRWIDKLVPDACGLEPPIILGTSPESQFTAWAYARNDLLFGPGIARQFGDLGQPSTT